MTGLFFKGFFVLIVFRLPLLGAAMFRGPRKKTAAPPAQPLINELKRMNSTGQRDEGGLFGPDSHVILNSHYSHPYYITTIHLSYKSKCLLIM
jgi:hypothetical protein